MYNVAFRVDCDDVTGFGHLSRCINFCRNAIETQSYSNTDFLFVGNFNIFSRTLLENFGLNYQPCVSLYEEERVVDIPCSKVVIDSYHLTQEKLNSYRSGFEKICIIDDTNALDFHQVDLVINFRIGAEKIFKYQARKTALGINYFQTKPELTMIRQDKLRAYRQRENVQQILVFMGGKNVPEEYWLDVLRAIELATEGKIRVICISEQAIPKIGRLKFRTIKPTVHIERLLAESDVCINGGGLIKYESAFCAITTASFSTTELQDKDTKYLASKGLIVDLGHCQQHNKRELNNAIKRLICDRSLRRRLALQSSRQFSNNSAKKLIRLFYSVM